MNDNYDKQAKAIKSLERSMKKCSDAGISLYGLDDNLIWVDNKAQKRIDNSYSHRHGAVSHFANDAEWDEGGAVNTHRCYIDSGGA